MATAVKVARAASKPLSLPLNKIKTTPFIELGWAIKRSFSESDAFYVNRTAADTFAVYAPCGGMYSFSLRHLKKAFVATMKSEVLDLSDLLEGGNLASDYSSVRAIQRAIRDLPEDQTVEEVNSELATLYLVRTGKNEILTTSEGEYQILFNAARFDVVLDAVAGLSIGRLPRCGE